MDDQTRIGIGAAAVIAIVSIIAADPSLRWWVFVLIIAIFFAAGLWGFWPLRKHGMTNWLYVPLHEVTSKLYGRTRGSSIAELAELHNKQTGDPRGDILNLYAYRLVQNGVPLYGVHPPSGIRERIKQSDMKGRPFADGATRMTGGDPSRTVYEGLAVRRFDLWRHRKTFKQWKMLDAEPRE